MKMLDEMDHYEVLEVPREARREEIERAFTLVRAAYEGDALAGYSVIPEEEAKLWRERIDEAWRGLSDADGRRAYDAALEALAVAVDATGPCGELEESQTSLAFDAWRSAEAGASGVARGEEPTPLPEAPSAATPAFATVAGARPLPVEAPPPAERPMARELEAFDEADEAADAVWDGPRLRRARLVRGLEIEDVATTTKINPTYLRFLEEERFDDLPAVVYVRGFVAAYARLLGLDPTRVAPSYVARFEEQRSATPRGRILGRR